MIVRTEQVSDKGNRFYLNVFTGKKFVLPVGRPLSANNPVPGYAIGFLNRTGGPRLTMGLVPGSRDKAVRKNRRANKVARRIRVQQNR